MTDEQTLTQPSPSPAPDGAAEPTAPEPAGEPVALLAPPPAPGPANPSPDGRTLAYLQADEGGAPRLWLAPTEGGSPQPLPPDPDLRLLPDDPDEGPQWSPDGATLAVVGEHPAGAGTAVWLVAVADGAARPLRDPDLPAGDRGPRWSPDGGRIAFVARRDGRDGLCVVPVDGGHDLQLTDGRRDAREPAWSPDGGRIAFIERGPDDEQPGGFREDVCTVRLETGEIKRLTTKPSPRRRSPRWAAHRPLIAYVGAERDWSHLLVVNPDNGAGWTMASETGDKAEPSWSPGGALLYTRVEGAAVRCCVRPLNAARAETIDPGDGVVRAPRWLPAPAPVAGERATEGEGERTEEAAEATEEETPAAAAPAPVERVVYAFAAADRAFGLVVQEPKPDAERTELPPAVPWEAGRALVAPTPLEFTAGSGTKLSGLVYRRAEVAGPAPGVVLVDDAPFGHRDRRVRPPEQSLAASGFAVFAPHLHGAAGLGRKVGDGLWGGADAETEVGDLADAAAALAGAGEVLPDRLAVVGRGYGGTLALLLAGGRPGIVQAAVAIDPVADWEAELERAPAAWRDWVLAQLGLPVANRARYAVRTPATFAAPIDVPLLLVGTAAAPAWRRAQLDGLVAVLREVGVPFELERVEEEGEAEPYRRAAAFLRAAFTAG